MADVWNVPQLNRPHSVRRIGRVSMFLASWCSTWCSQRSWPDSSPSTRTPSGSRHSRSSWGFAINVALFLLGFRILTPNSIATKTLLTARSSRAGMDALQYLGTWLVGHELRHASQLYGYFASILGLVFFLYLAPRSR